MGINKKVVILAVFLILFNINFIFAEDFGFNYLQPGENLNDETFINYTEVNVNNSNFWDGYDTPLEYGIVQNNTGGWLVNFTKTLINTFLVREGTQTWYVEEHDGDIHFHFPDLGGSNYIGWSTTGAFMEMYANPNPSNDYKMWTVTETQGADTEINIYEGGTTHNRFWSSGSVRIGGGADYLCTNLTDVVDCDTPLTGADLVVQDDIWLGGKLFPEDGIYTDYIDFNITINPEHSEGRIHWDEDDKTLNIDTEVSDVMLQVGQEQYLRVNNQLGVQVNNGQVVYVNGAQGNRPTIQLAQADTEVNSTATIGVATHNISDSSNGYVTVYGLVRDVDTSSFSAGDTLYLSPTTPGGLTNVRPDAPNHMVTVGYALNSVADEGAIFVHVTNGFELDELHDVNVTGLVNNSVLQYNSDKSFWENAINLVIDGIANFFDDVTIHANLNVTQNITMGVNQEIDFGDGYKICRNSSGLGIGNLTC